MVGRIIDQSETSLVDVIDNLLTRGVVLNADLILALADVDLVYSGCRRCSARPTGCFRGVSGLGMTGFGTSG